MSDILIYGMETPKSCAECLDIGWHYVFECRLDDMEDGERLPSCPLIELPPHGQLGDLDKLKQLFSSIDRALYSAADVVEIIDSAPTIIPAEEGE